MFSNRINRAIQVSAIAHQGQFRKDPNLKIPYIAHPVAVGMMLAQHGYDEDVIMAGILHDTVEDTDVTMEDLRRDFGDTVADLVDHCSEQDKSLPWEERKKRYIEHLKTAPQEAQAISCCDKTHNMMSMLDSGPVIWEKLTRGKEIQISRYGQMLSVFQETLPPEMVRKYEEVFQALKDL